MRGVDDATTAGSYDAVAATYDERLGDELEGKPLDRALLTAFLELAGDGRVADLGCGPGHVTRWLRDRHPDVVGLDLSPGMVAVARSRDPEGEYVVGSMTALPAEDDTWAGAVALYSVIHLDDADRRTAFGELARVVRRGGPVLVSFHVDDTDFASGETYHATELLGLPVTLDFHLLDPAVVRAQLVEAGFVVVAETVRQPDPEVEHASRRGYLLARLP